MPLQERLDVISDRQAAHELHTAKRFWEIRQRLGEVERRVMSQSRPRKSRMGETLGFLGQVATVKTWFIGGVLVALALKGTLSATEWKSIFLSLIGNGSSG